MKRSVMLILLGLLLVSFTGSMYYIYSKNKENPIVYETETPTKDNIVNKAVATGSIVPEEEVLIKPNISGVIEEVYVEGGDYVKNGDLIAKIRVIPNLATLNNAKNTIESSKIALENQKRLYERQQSLFAKKVIPQQDIDQAEANYKQALQSYNAALENYEIIKTGSTKGVGKAANTLIKSTVTGMILEVPVEVGNQVIEANNFNEGTTIASVADVNRMLFEGKVDESEVGKIKEGLPLEITVGAIDNATFNAVLNYIAPKGNLENGAIQFEIKGSLKKNDSIFVRAGLSANASIIIARADSVLSLKEALIQFDKETKKPFVEVMTGEQVFERRDVVLGVSDGLNVEIKSGIKEGDKVKVWNQLKKPEEGPRQ